MAILAECPICHRKQGTKNKLCACGEDLDKGKRQKNKIKYWVSYRVQGKQRRELVGHSIEKARDVDGKRRSQKREKRFFYMMPEVDATFQELTDWYLDLEELKGKRYYREVKNRLKRFNAMSLGKGFRLALQ
jgi:hypothetical protein